MAHTLSGAHNIRKNAAKRSRNKVVKSSLRTQMKKVLVAVGKKDKKASTEELSRAYGLLDRAAQKGVLHANAAARYKSRLADKVLALK